MLSRTSDNTTSQNIGEDQCMGGPSTSNFGGDRPPSPPCLESSQRTPINKPIRHFVCAGALGRVKPNPRVVPLNELLTINSLLQVYEVSSVCIVATTITTLRAGIMKKLKFLLIDFHR